MNRFRLLLLSLLLASSSSFASQAAVDYGVNTQITFTGTTIAAFISAYNVARVDGYQLASCTGSDPLVAGTSLTCSFTNFPDTRQEQIISVDQTSAPSGVDFGSSPKMLQAVFIAVCGVCFSVGVFTGQQR